ncbi:hypothetical protein TrRE_jg5342 [Triparma retinervis]|uniref:protein-serine/threonine phosphatase n=1 Tax=Triparma retinervis TaxID=2557542 RepID=A0A9W7E4M9_9STRA|nr:hypothetical protein TrRE_jg5342 [Triparma retinervis]
MSSFTTAPAAHFLAIGQNSFAGPLILLNHEPHVSVDGMLTHDSFIVLPRNSRASSNAPPQPLLHVPLTSISTVRSTPSCPNSFSVTLDSAQSCHLQSSSKKEMNRWLFEFQRSLSHLLKKRLSDVRSTAMGAASPRPHFRRSPPNTPTTPFPTTNFSPGIGAAPISQSLQADSGFVVFRQRQQQAARSPAKSVDGMSGDIGLTAYAQSPSSALSSSALSHGHGRHFRGRRKPPTNIGSTSNQGVRSSQEDRHVVINFTSASGAEITLCGIFDGHCGDQASEFCASNLFRVFNSCLELQSTLVNAVKATFTQLDHEFCTIAKENGWESGTTGIIVVIHGDKLICGNVGDCRAVAGRVYDPTSEDIWTNITVNPPQQHSPSEPSSFTAISPPPTTYSFMDVAPIHKASMPEEEKRILNSNGWVTRESDISIGHLNRLDLNDPDVIHIIERNLAQQTSGNNNNPGRLVEIDRVCGELAVSRSLGDLDFKGAYQDKDSEGWWMGPNFLPYAQDHSMKFRGDLVTSEADVTECTIRPHDYIALCCDGITDVMELEDVARITSNLLYQQSATAQTISGRLVELALQLGSSDNCTLEGINYLTVWARYGNKTKTIPVFNIEISGVVVYVKRSGKRLTFAIDDSSSPTLDYNSSPTTVDCSLWCVDRYEIPISFFDGAGDEADNNMGIKKGDRVLVRGKVRILNESSGREVDVQQVQKITEEEEAYFWCDLVRIHEMIVNDPWEEEAEELAKAVKQQEEKARQQRFNDFDGGINDEDLMALDCVLGTATTSSTTAEAAPTTSPITSPTTASTTSAGKKRPAPQTTAPSKACPCPPHPPTALITILKLQSKTFPSTYCHCKCSKLNPPTLDSKFTFRDSLLFLIHSNASAVHTFDTLRSDGWLETVAKDVIGEDNATKRDYMTREVLRVCLLDGILFDGGAGQYRINPAWGTDG